MIGNSDDVEHEFATGRVSDSFSLVLRPSVVLPSALKQQ